MILPKITTFEQSDVGYTRPEAFTVCCGLRVEHFRNALNRTNFVTIMMGCAIYLIFIDTQNVIMSLKGHYQNIQRHSYNQQAFSPHLIFIGTQNVIMRLKDNYQKIQRHLYNQEAFNQHNVNLIASRI